MKRILLKNSFSGVIQLIITTLLTFITIPIFINLLGDVKYGLFAIISVIGNLNLFSNLGLNITLTKYVAEQGKTKQTDFDIWVTFILLLIITIPLSIVAISLSKTILLNLLGIPIEYIIVARTLFISLVIANFLLLMGQCFVSVINAVQKMYISNMLRLCYSVMYWCFILIVLFLGYDLIAIGYSILSAAIIYLILVFSFFLKLWGMPRIDGLLKNFRRTIKKQFSYSLKIYFTSLLTFFFNPLTKILLSNFVGLTEVGYFDIVLRVKNTALRLLTKPLEALFPMQAQLKDKVKSRLLVHDIEQKCFYFVVPLIIATIFIIEPLMFLWLGYKNPFIVNGTIWISVFYLIGLTTTPNYQYLFAKGYAASTIYMQMVNVLVNLLVFLFTFSIFGFYAAIIANVAAILSSFSLNLYYQHKYLRSLIFDSVNQIIKLFSAASLIFLIVAVFSITILSQINSLLQIIFYLLIISISTLITYRYFRIISEDDIKRYLSFNIYLEKFFRRILIR